MSGEEQPGVASSDSNQDLRLSSPATRRRGGLLVFHKGLLLVFSPLLIQLVLIAALALVLLQLDEESVSESRYRRCAAIGAHLIALANLAAIDVMVWFQSNNPEVLNAYDHAVSGVKREEVQLKELTRNDRLSQKSAGELIDSVDKLVAMLDSIAELAKQRNLLEMAALIPELDKELKTSKSTHLEHISSVTLAQEKIAEESTRRQDALRSRQSRIIFFGLLSNGFLSVFLFLYYRKSIAGRLKVVRENTGRLAESKVLSSPLSGADEIAQLDRAFHQMNAELSAASERERSLFENASDVICVLNVENKFVRINQACKTRWGRTVDELLNKSVRAVCQNVDGDKAEDLCLNARHGGEKARFELRVVGADGSAFETLWTTYWSANEQQLYAVVHDVNERKRIERTKQAYLSMISSDLRIPLAAIAEATEQLAQNRTKSLSAQALERVEIVSKNIGRLLLLVNDLLEVSELESGTLELSPEQSQVEPLLIRSVHDLEGLAQKKQIRFRIECSATTCWLDPNRIIQVIVNLASNAIKFSPEETEVILRASESAGNLLLEIIDSGRGVPDAHKKTIFEKFKQVHSSDGKRQSGTGLGLPICKDIVEKHGGEIGVSGEEGNGSNFWFRIPLGSSSALKPCFQTDDGAASDQLSCESSEYVEIEDRLTSKEPIRNGTAAASPGSAGVPPAFANSVPGTGISITAPAENSGSQRSQGGLGSVMSLNQKGLLLILLPLAVEFIFVLAIFNVIAQVNTSRQEELKERAIAATAFEIMNSFYKMIVSITPSSKEAFWLAFDECARREQRDRILLAKLLSKEPAALRQFRAADRACLKLDPTIEKLRDAFLQKGYSDQLFDDLHPGRFEIIAATSAVSRRLLLLIDDVEKKQSISPAQQAELRKKQGGILLAGLAANILLSLLLARFFARNIATRLATLADNTLKLARNQPLNPLLPGTDEIAELDKAFHTTAEKILETRKKERAVFDNSQDLIASLDSDLHFVAVNVATERALSYSREELVKKSIGDFFADNERVQLMQLFRSTASNLPALSVETSLASKLGAQLFLQWSLSRSPADDNIYCVAHDITDRKQLEQLKQDFLAIVSHDLRNPLGSVMGFVSLILAGALGETAEDARPLLELIMTEAEALLSLINDLLDLEKLEAQSMQLVLAKESAGKVAYLAYESLKTECPGLVLDFAADSEEIELQCDIERLSPVFHNIFAHLFRRHLRLTGKAELQVQIELEKLPGDIICWTIANCEIPVPYEESEINMLFERFRVDFQGQLELKSAEVEIGRSGELGLLIAKRLVEAHRGSLVLSNDSSAPQAFVVKIPAQQDNAPSKSDGA